MADAFATGLSAVEPLSPRAAMDMMRGSREADAASPEAEAPEQPEQESVPPADEAGVEQPEKESTSDEEDGAATASEEEQPSGDDDEQKDAADEPPPIPMPASWSKEERDVWESLPRDQQERLAERERVRRIEIDRRLQEIAERNKSVDAEVQAAQQARDQYKSGIESLAAQASTFIASEFSDIKTWEDVHRMAAEDPARFTRWKAATEQAQALHAERQRLAAEDQAKQAQAFENYARQEIAEFVKAAPEFADPKQGAQLREEARLMLIDDYGFSDDELNALWTGAPMSIHDHRIQLAIRDALAFKKAKAKVATKPKPKPASPPPQKPGTPPAKGEAKFRALEQADKELTRTGSRAAALRLMKAARAR